MAVAERDGPQPSGASAKAWRAAVRFYVDHVGERSHWDHDMLVLKDTLVTLGGDPEATPPDRIAGIAEHLEAAMPAYLETWWPAHDAANRGWIAIVEDDVRKYEEAGSRW